MSDMSVLQKEVDRVVDLINEASVILNQPVFHVREDFEHSLSKNSSKIAVHLQKAVNKGRLDEAVIGGAVLGVAYLGAAIYDGVKNNVAHSNARQKLSAYYQELSVKQNLLIEEQQNIINMLSNHAKALGQKEAQLRAKLKQLESILERISQAQREKSI